MCAATQSTTPPAPAARAFPTEGTALLPPRKAPKTLPRRSGCSYTCSPGLHHVYWDRWSGAGVGRGSLGRQGKEFRLETGVWRPALQNKNWPDRSRASCTFTRSVFLSIVRGHLYGHHRFEALFMHTYIYLCTNPLSKSIKNKTGENEWDLFLVFYSS